MGLSSLGGILARMSIARKVVLLFAVNVSVAIAISTVCLVYLDMIRAELSQVAHEDIPLTQKITSLSNKQLEQAVYLERAIRLGSSMRSDSGPNRRLQDTIESFNQYDSDVNELLEQTIGMLEGFLRIDHKTFVVDEFESVLASILGIKNDHSQFGALARETFDLVQSGDASVAAAKIERLVQIEERLDKKVVAVLEQFAVFTARSLNVAEQHEKDAIVVVLIVSVLALCVSSILSVWVIITVSRPLRDIKAALQSLGNGIVKELPTFQPDSEIGGIFDSIARIGDNLNAINRTQGALYLDLDGRVEFSNDQISSMLGLEPSDVQGIHFRSFIDDSPDTWDQKWESAKHGAPFTIEVKLKSAASQPVWIQATVNPILGADKATTRLIIYTLDISEEVSRRREIAMLSLVAAETDNLVVITDAQERIEYVNDGFTRLTGYSVEECLGKKPGQLLQGKDTSQETRQQIRRQIETGQPFYDEILNYTRDGKPYWVSMAINPVFDESGEIVRFVSIQGDVTANKIRNLENERGMSESVAVLKALAQGDLTQPMTGDYDGAFKAIGSAINDTIARLIGVVNSIRTVAGTVDIAAREIAAGNLDLSKRTELSATSLDEITGSMKQITAVVSDSTRHSNQANEFAGAAQSEAERGGRIVGDAMSAMAEIHQSSKKIADITGVIDDIAFQTNLLALNASVEAARAGEQGRGFAVVASEVRNLASRSASAAKEIEDLIKRSVQQVENGVELVRQSEQTLESIVQRVEKVTDIVSEMNSASQQQAKTTQSVHRAIIDLDESTQQNAALVQQAAVASQSTTQEADNLINLIDFFDVPPVGTANVTALRKAG